MTIEALKQRREQVQVAMQQNHYTMQGHINEIDFQIQELLRASGSGLNPEPEQLISTEDSNQSPVNVE